MKCDDLNDTIMMINELSDLVESAISTQQYVHLSGGTSTTMTIMNVPSRKVGDRL